MDVLFILATAWEFSYSPDFFAGFCMATLAHRGQVHFRCLWKMCPLTSFIGTLHFGHVTCSSFALIPSAGHNGHP